MMTPIKHAARFLNGAAFKPSDWGEEGLPILRIAQLSGKPFDNYFSGSINRSLHIKNGDLLFSWSATIDAFLWDRGDAILNQHIFKVIPKNGVEKKYLYYLIKAHAPRWAEDDAHGSTMKHIKKEALSNKVWLPDINTQKAIADFLDYETGRIDALIAKRGNFNVLLDEAKLSLATEAVSGRLSSNLDRRDAGWIGDIPAHWKMERARFHFKERVGRSETGDEELLTCSHITGVTKRSEKSVNMFLAESNVGHKLVQPDDLVINTMWAWMGAMGVAKDEGIISPAYGIYRPTSGELLPQYAEILVRSAAFIAEATRRSKGIHSSRLRLYTDAFYDIYLPIPPLAEQEAILDIVTRRRGREEALRAKNEASVQLLKELRSALITSAVTGQIDPTTYGHSGNIDRELDWHEKEISA